MSVNPSKMATTNAEVCNVLVRRVATNDYRSVIDLFNVSKVCTRMSAKSKTLHLRTVSCSCFVVPASGRIFSMIPQNWGRIIYHKHLTKINNHF